MITRFLGAGVIAAALAAAPAAAQYYPGYGSPYGNGYQYPGYGNLDGNPYGYGYNMPGGSQVAANQCTAAVQRRLGGYGGYGYGYGRGLTITSVEIRSGGGYKVRGIAGAGGYGYGRAAVPFSCRTDPRGFVADVDIAGGEPGNGYYGDQYRPYGDNGYENPYEAYGYVRY
jgi:hypothetical protein